MPKIFIVNDERRADENIFIVHNDSYADEKDIIVHSASCADKSVFIVQEAYRAKKKVFLVNNSWDSDPVKPPKIISPEEKENPSPVLDFIFNSKILTTIYCILGLPIALVIIFFVLCIGLWLLAGILSFILIPFSSTY